MKRRTFCGAALGLLGPPWVPKVDTDSAGPLGRFAATETRRFGVVYYDVIEDYCVHRYYVLLGEYIKRDAAEWVCETSDLKFIAWAPHGRIPRTYHGWSLAEKRGHHDWEIVQIEGEGDFVL